MNSLFVVILYGGRSSEHEISRMSAFFVKQALDNLGYKYNCVGITRNGQWYLQEEINVSLSANEASSLEINQTVAINPWRYFDDLVTSGKDVVVFPVLHGPYGEDGTVQGFFDLMNLAYVGPDVTGSAVGMDKILSKRLVQGLGVAVSPWVDTDRECFAQNPQDFIKFCLEKLRFPMFVKPNRQGSSVGVTCVENLEDLNAACSEAFNYDERILVEQGIKGRELECALLGGFYPQASAVGEVRIISDGFYDYQAKYFSKTAAEVLAPAPIDQKLSEQVRQLACHIFYGLHLFGMARVDFFLEEQSQRLIFNEVNTIPGLTPISQYPKLWGLEGLSSQDLVKQLIELAWQRHMLRKQLRVDPGL